MKIDGSRIVDIGRRLLILGRRASKIPITVRNNIRGILDTALVDTHIDGNLLPVFGSGCKLALIIAKRDREQCMHDSEEIHVSDV
eukprot:COSAG01_NODE_5285_length_4356_cov_44.815833_3_plen_85_part_00